MNRTQTSQLLGIEPARVARSDSTVSLRAIVKRALQWVIERVRPRMATPAERAARIEEERRLSVWALGYAGLPQAAARKHYERPRFFESA